MWIGHSRLMHFWFFSQTFETLSERLNSAKWERLRRNFSSDWIAEAWISDEKWRCLWRTFLLLKVIIEVEFQVSMVNPVQPWTFPSRSAHARRINALKKNVWRRERKSTVNKCSERFSHLVPFVCSSSCVCFMSLLGLFAKNQQVSIQTTYYRKEKSFQTSPSIINNIQNEAFPLLGKK